MVDHNLLYNQFDKQFAHLIEVFGSISNDALTQGDCTSYYLTDDGIEEVLEDFIELRKTFGIAMSDRFDLMEKVNQK